jgi:hypothetical protein
MLSSFDIWKSLRLASDSHKPPIINYDWRGTRAIIPAPCSVSQNNAGDAQVSIYLDVMTDTRCAESTR